MRRTMMWVPVVAAGFVFTQQMQPQTASKGARELFYFAADKKDKLEPIRTAAAKPKPRPVVQPTEGSTTPKEVEEPPSPNAVKNLGFRYSVLLIGADGKEEPVDSDRNFRRGECFALSFEPNRSGYLYVLAKQSDGAWMPLLPSAELADEKNVVDPGQRVRVPAQACFRVEEPAGTETLFVVLSRDPRDVYDLNEAIKNSNQPAPAPTPQRRVAEPVQTASARMGAEIAAMTRFGTRNLSFQKTTQPQKPDEMPFSKYVVNASDKPMTKVVAQLEIRHR